MRLRLFSLLALKVLLTACASDTADAPAVPASDATDLTAASSGDTSALIGVWRETGRKQTLDGSVRESNGTITWTFRPDGTALHFQQFEQLGPDPVTEDLTWACEGSMLILNNAAMGDERWRLEVAERAADAMTLHNAARSEYYVLERE